MTNDTMQGRFITFEGGEGVGKSTNIEFAAHWLHERGFEVIVTREPGGTEIAERIRNDLLKAHHGETMQPLTEVLFDRFTDSTIAYQGYGRGLDQTTIHALKELVQQGLEPDLTILLDAPLDVGMGRAQRRGQSAGEETDRFEVEQRAFFERVQQGFQALAASEARFRIVDASQPLADVQTHVVMLLEEWV